MPTTLQPLSFRDVDQIYTTAQGLHPQFAAMSLQEFSRYANTKTGTRAFDSGLSGALGRTVKRISTGADMLMEPVSDAFRAGGESIGSLISPRVGEIMGNVGEGTPRAAGQMLAALPLAAAVTAGAPVSVPVGIAGALGLAGTAAQTYTDTGSALAGLVAAGTTAAMPGAARVGTGLAVKGLTKVPAKVLPKVAERVGEYVGANVGAAAAGELGSQLTGLVSGQGLHNPLTLENIIAQTAGQLPFAAFDIPQLVRGYKPIGVGANNVGVAPVGYRDLGRPAPIPSLTDWSRAQTRLRQVVSGAAQGQAAAGTAAGATARTVQPPTQTPPTSAATPPGQPPLVTGTQTTKGAQIKQAMTGLASGTTDSLYDTMWAALQKGETKVAGMTDSFLVKAKPLYDQGLIKTRDDLKLFANDKLPGAPTIPAATTASKITHTPQQVNDEILKVLTPDITPVDLYKALPVDVQESVPGATPDDRIRYIDAALAAGLGVVKTTPPIKNTPAKNAMERTLTNVDALETEAKTLLTANPHTTVQELQSKLGVSRKIAQALLDKHLPKAPGAPAAKPTVPSTPAETAKANKRFKALSKKKDRTPEEEAEFQGLEATFGQATLALVEPAVRDETGKVHTGGQLHALIPGTDGAKTLERGWLVDGAFKTDAEWQTMQAGKKATATKQKEITDDLKKMEEDGADPDRILRAKLARQSTSEDTGQTATEWAVGRSGLDVVTEGPASPEDLLRTTRSFFEHYFYLQGYDAANATELVNLATRLAARFAPQLPGARVAGAASGSTSFYAQVGQTPVIALSDVTLTGQPPALQLVTALGHEAYHGLEVAYVRGTLPEREAQSFRFAMTTANAMTPKVRAAVIKSMADMVIGPGAGEARIQARWAFYEGSRGASEFLADYTALLALSQTTKSGHLAARDIALFGDQPTRGFLRTVTFWMRDTIEAIKAWRRGSNGIDRLIEPLHEVLSKNLTALLSDVKKADDAALAFSAVMDRSNSDIVDFRPVLHSDQVEQYLRWKNQQEGAGAEVTPVPREEFDAALREMEEIPGKIKPYGDRMSWFHWGFPMSQLAASFPQLKGAVDLGFAHHGMAAKYIQETWGAHFLNERGKVDRARLGRIGKDGSNANKGFNAAALFQNVEQKPLTGGELEALLVTLVPGISQKDIQDIDTSLQQFGQMNVRLANQRLKSHRDDIKGAVSGLVMSHDRDLRANAAWTLAETLVNGAFDGQFPDRVAGVVQGMTDAGYGPDLAKSVADAVEANYLAHEKLAERLLGVNLQGKPWWSSEVRMGEWMVAYKTNTGGRRLEGYKSQSEAEARYRVLEQRADLEYIKAFNKSDRAQTFRQTQSELIDAYKEADQVFYQSVVSKIRDKNPELAAELETMYQPGQGATRMTTSPHMLERELQGGRELLNMVSGQVHYVDSTAYGLAKRYVKNRQRSILMDPVLRDNEQLRGVAKNYLSAVTDPEGKEFTGLKNMVFLTFMGFNPSYFVVEPVQLLSSHAPLLVRHGDGIGEAHARIARAAAAVGSGSLRHLMTKDGEIVINPAGLKGGITSTDVVDLLEQGKLARVIETGFVSDMFSLEDTDFLATRSMLTGSGKVEGVKDLVRNSAYWMARMARSFYGIAPRFNGRVALLSAYEQARMNGAPHAEAISQAITNTRESMFGGGVVNRPMALHSLGKAQGVGGLIYSLQSYTANMYSLMGRLLGDSLSKNGLAGHELKSARKALLNAGTTQLLLGGLMGFPGVAAAIAVWEQLFKDADVKRDLRGALFKLGGDDEDMGNLFAEAGMGGVVNAALPVADIGSRFQLGTFFGISPYDGFSWKNLFGPTGSMVEAYGKGLTGLIQGETQGLINAMPSGVRGALKLMQNSETLLDAKGKALMNPTTTEKMLMLSGFKPRRLAQHYEKSAMDLRAQEIADRDRDHFLSEMADLAEAGRFDELTASMQRRQQELPGMFDVKAAAVRVAEIVQARRTPRLGQNQGTREAAYEQQQINQLYPSIAPEPGGQVDAFKERQALVRQMGIPGAGRPDPSALRRVMMIDKLMRENPRLTRSMAAAMVERALSPRTSRQRYGPPVSVP